MLRILAAVGLAILTFWLMHLALNEFWSALSATAVFLLVLLTGPNGPVDK